MLAVAFLSLRWREFWLVRAGWWVGFRHNVQGPASVQRALPPLAPQVFGFRLGWPSKGKYRWPVSSDLWPLKSHSWHALLFGEEWEQWKYSHPTLPRPLDIKTPSLDFFFFFFAIALIHRLSHLLPCHCQDQAIVRKGLLHYSHIESSRSAFGLSVRLHLGHLASFLKWTQSIHDAFCLTALLLQWPDREAFIFAAQKALTELKLAWFSQKVDW